MTREELEKKIDEKYSEIQSKFDLYSEDLDVINDRLKDFIFETIIPEVLKSITIERQSYKLGSENQELYVAYANGYNDALEEIKSKVKQLYNIDL